MPLFFALDTTTALFSYAINSVLCCSAPLVFGVTVGTLFRNLCCKLFGNLGPLSYPQPTHLHHPAPCTISSLMGGDTTMRVFLFLGNPFGDSEGKRVD